MEIDEKEWLRRENHFLREKIKKLNDEIKNYQKSIVQGEIYGKKYLELKTELEWILKSFHFRQ